MKTYNFIWIQNWSLICWKSDKTMAMMQKSSFEKPRLFDQISLSDCPRHYPTICPHLKCPSNAWVKLFESNNNKKKILRFLISSFCTWLQKTFEIKTILDYQHPGKAGEAGNAGGSDSRWRWWRQYFGRVTRQLACG